MVGHGVDFDPDALAVASLHEGPEIVGGSEVGVDLVSVASPEVVVFMVEIFHHRVDPAGIEAHVLDVAEVVFETIKRSAAVVIASGVVVGCTTASSLHLVGLAMRGRLWRQKVGGMDRLRLLLPKKVQPVSDC